MVRKSKIIILFVSIVISTNIYAQKDTTSSNLHSKNPFWWLNGGIGWSFNVDLNYVFYKGFCAKIGYLNRNDFASNYDDNGYKVKTIGASLGYSHVSKTHIFALFVGPTINKGIHIDQDQYKNVSGVELNFQFVWRVLPEIGLFTGAYTNLNSYYKFAHSNFGITFIL
ncbi:MAG: hypothetical protein JEY94_19230 [Melioribacteraceae bacterium]|nr:hypothetical protein [Melioribacteraceae bacterium]